MRSDKGATKKGPAVGSGVAPPLERELGYAGILFGAGTAIGTIVWLVAERVNPNPDRQMGVWIGLGGALGFVVGLMYFVWAATSWPIAAAITAALTAGAIWLMGGPVDADD